MTPDAIITMARIQYGEPVALIVSDESFEAWLNAAIKEAYNDLPAESMRRVVVSTEVALTAGVGDIPSEWDRIHDVTFAGAAIPRVDPESIVLISTNPFLEPFTPVYSITGTEIIVRPTTVTEVRVVHQEPPADIDFTADGDSELTTVDPRWHPALAHLVTSYAYQQEEDHNAAAHWRGRYAAQVGQAAPPPPAVPGENQE